MTPETTIKTVPPRPKGRALLGFLAGVLLGAVVFAGWFSLLPVDQRALLKPYIRATVKTKFRLPHAKTSPAVRQAQHDHQYLKDNVYDGREPWEMAYWPLGITAALALVGAILGGRMDSKMMRELRAGRVLAGRRVETVKVFNKRMWGAI